MGWTSNTDGISENTVENCIHKKWRENDQKGRPQTRWIDHIKNIIEMRGENGKENRK